MFVLMRYLDRVDREVDNILRPYRPRDSTDPHTHHRPVGTDAFHNPGLGYTPLSLYHKLEETKI